MAENFDRVYPAKDRLRFNQGLNSKFDIQLLDDNESPDCLNVVFNADSVETRGGTSKLNTASVGSFVGDGLYTRHDISGAQTMTAWWGGSLYRYESTSFNVVTNATAVFTAGVRVASEEYENHRFYSNGSGTPYKYNGSYFSTHGVPAPTATATVASTVTGSLASAGTYTYGFTYVNSAAVEGDLSPLTASFVVTSSGGEGIYITSIPVGDDIEGVSARNIYRTDPGSATLKRITTISDNTTTTYTDEGDTGGVEAPTDKGTPPAYDAIVFHQNRLFMNDPANPNLIWYTDLAEPYTVGATNFIAVGDKSFNLIRGFDVLDDAILIHTDNNPWLIYMPDTDPANWQAIRCKASYGCKSPYGTFRYENKIMFPAIRDSKIVGFAAIEGAVISPDATFTTVSATLSDLKSNKIEPDIFDIQEAYVKNISAYTFQSKAYISVTYGAGETTNNRIYVFDFSYGQLKKSDGIWAPWSGLYASQFCEYAGDLYYQDSRAVGFVYEMNTATANDSGSAINSYFWSKEYSGVPGEEAWTKDFRKIELLYENTGDYFMSFSYRLDSATGVGTSQQVDLDPGGSLWGAAILGTDTWGGGQNQSERQLFLGQVRGKRIQYKFSNQNTANQKFKILGLKFSYNRKGRR